MSRGSRSPTRCRATTRCRTPEPTHPNVVLIVARRPRLRAARAASAPTSRRPHIDRARRRRAALQPLPRHRAVLADAGVPAHRPQPPRRRHGLPHRHADGVPRATRAASRSRRRRCRGSCATRATTRSRSASGTSSPGGERSRRGPVRPVAARVRVRALLRVPPGRHQPLGAATSCATTTTSSRRARREDGYHLTEDLADTAIRVRHRDQQQAAPDRPFFLYFALGAMHAPHHVAPEWVEPYRGRVRRRVGASGATDVFARQVASRRRARRAPRSRERPSWVARVGRRCRPTSSACSRASRRCSPASSAHTDAQIGRVRRPARRDRRARQHAGDARVRQRRERRRRRARARSTSTASPSTSPDTVEGNLACDRRARRPPLLQPLLVGLGVGGQHAAAPVEALHVARRHPHAADRALAATASRRGGEVRDQFVHAIDLMPTVLDACGVDAPDDRRRRGAAADRRRVDPRHVRPTPRRRRRATVQYFEMLGLAVDRRRRLEGDHRPRVEGRRRRGAAARGQPRLRRRPVGAVRPRRRLRRGARRRRRASRGGRATSQARWLVEAERNQVLPLVDELIGRIAAVVPRPNAIRRARCVYRPEGGPGARRLGAAALRRVPPRRRGRRARATAPCRRCSPRWATGRAGSRSTCATAGWSFVLNRAGDGARVVSEIAVPAGRHDLAAVYTPGFEGPGLGLLHDDELVALGGARRARVPMVFAARRHRAAARARPWASGVRRLRAAVPVERRAPRGRHRDRTRDRAVTRRAHARAAAPRVVGTPGALWATRTRRRDGPGAGAGRASGPRTPSPAARTIGSAGPTCRAARGRRRGGPSVGNAWCALCHASPP